MGYHFIIAATFLVLVACTTGITPAPTATLTESPPPKTTMTPQTPPTATAAVAPVTPTSNFGTVIGEICYPSSEPPPMTLYLKNLVSKEITPLDIERGQGEFSVNLSVGKYIAFADTVGMHLRGAYLCDSDEPCPFPIEPDQATNIDLCGWYSPPGVRPPSNKQPVNHVIVKLLQNMNARTGPQLSYDELGLVEAGTSLRALRRSSDGEWLLVEEPELHITGWLHRPLVRILGDPNDLPVETELPDAGLAIEQFTPANWHSSHNGDIVHFKGQIRDEANRPVNGFSILLDNGTWSVLSHPTGASHHYPDVTPGSWDVVIPNETDAAGWWTMTVVRYECPDFQTGFNAQCKQFTPLSETKVIPVIHPDENVIEINWTCLDNCDQGLYLKPYRHPVDPLPDNLLLYIEDRALRSSPPSPVFDHIELKTLYDDLPESDDGLKAYLADNRPILSPDGRHLLINGPRGVTWLAELDAGALHEISHPSVPAVWSPTSSQLAFVKDDTLYIYEISGGSSQAIWSHTGLVEPQLRWSEWITIKTREMVWRISPNGQEAIAVEPEAESMADYLARQGLPPNSAWALSHDQQKVAYSRELDDPLENEIYIFTLESQSHQPIGPLSGYRVAEIRWTAGDELLVIGATNPNAPSGGAIFTMRPEAGTLPEIWHESDSVYLVEILPEHE